MSSRSGPSGRREGVRGAGHHGPFGQIILPVRTVSWALDGQEIRAEGYYNKESYLELAVPDAFVLQRPRTVIAS
jgi:hypothetical protein